jgi:F-type H+-transporting ATPase subunit gamma
MAATQDIKRRIKSVKNTKKITKAMELVAASKMKRAVSSTLASREYAGYSWEILTSISNSIDENEHALFAQRSNLGEVKKILLVLITSNRGLCGAYNAQVIKKSIALMKGSTNANIDVLSVGKKGEASMKRLGRNIMASFTELGDNITLQNILPVSRLVVDEYLKGNYDQVLVAYTDFVSALTQKPNIKQILPISKIEIKKLINDLQDITHEDVKKESKTEYLFEGDMNKLLSSLAEKLVRMQIYQMMLESNASEQSSRMVAMKNASEASGEMIDELTLIFNKARQSNITREISEISAGMASVS